MTTSKAGESNVEAAIAAVRELMPGRVETGLELRRQHANTVSFIASEPPDAVAWPQTTEEVVQIVRIAARHRCPVIAFGAGTSLEGHVNAPHGGLSLDMSRMNRILAVNAPDLDCVVEAGVTRRQLNEHLRDCGLFFAVDPGAEEATLGGMAATRASGTNTVRYGTMRDNVVNLTAVMADGSVVRTGGRARKSAAGFDLARLLIGSEGTLGIITQLTLRLHPVPASIAAAVCPFASIEGACNAAIEAIEAGLGLARIELLDAVQIGAVNIHSKLALDEAPTLFVEFHGTPAATREAVEAFGDLARAHGALRFDWAEGHEERRRLWKARHDAYWAVRTAWPGKTMLATDVCVPISRLAECVRETADDLCRSRLIAPIVGHVGDGNFHVIPVFDAEDREEAARVEGFVGRLVRRALEMDGTSTGEHGIGQGKIKYLEEELGPGVEVMRRIKRALDPQGILNPGKVFIVSG
jgi:D-lactate dehydrogenase (cytochrome)